MREERRRATEVRGRGLRAGERRPARRQGERETQARTAETKQNPEEDTSTVAALDSRESGGRDDGNDGGTRAACDHSEDDESPAVGQTRIHAHEQKPTSHARMQTVGTSGKGMTMDVQSPCSREASTALGYFLGDTKAVLNGCEDHWTLPDRSAMPLLFQMTVCVDIRVVRPGAWVAFSYSSVYAPKPELGLEGDDGALYGWLLRVRHRFPLRLSPTVWHRVCLRRDVRRNSFSLEVDGAMVAERTVIAQAIAPSGSLQLGCRPRDRLFGAERGEVELYLFRMWADLGHHGLCEDGTVIGWDTRYWRFSSLNARQTDPNLLCDAFFWMSLSAEAKKSSNINTEVKDLVSKALKCNRQPAKFLDFCQPDKKVEVVDVSCSAEEADGENSEKKAPRNATCGVLLKLSPAVSACELQRAGVIALQQAGNAKIRARITGEVERVGRNLCEDLKSPGGNFVRCKFTTSLDDFCQSSTHSSFNCSLLELNHHDPGQQPVTQSCSGEKSRFCDCTTFCNSSSKKYYSSACLHMFALLTSSKSHMCIYSSLSCSDYSEISQQYKVGQLVGQLEKLLDGPTVSQSVGQKAIGIISNLMDGDPAALSASANRLIRVVDSVGLRAVVSGDREILSSNSLVLAIRTVDGTNFPSTSVNIFNSDNVQIRALDRSRYKRSGSALGSVFLPSTLTAGLSPEQQQQASRVQFTFHTKNAFFQDKALDDKTLVSPVLGASVANLSISNLTENILFTIRNINPMPGNFVASCAFWDFTVNDGQGGWSSAGCFVVNATSDDTTCSCNHLTSFAILLDLSRDVLIDRQHAQILTFVTYIGCGISAIFLAVTLLTYLSFEKLLRDIPAKILVQLCLSLLLLNLVFLLDGWLALYPAIGLCISTAFFLHYFLLTSFTWAGLEALHMYLSIVQVFTPYLSRYMLKFSLMGWGIPLLVVIIIISVDKDNYGLVTYGKYSDGTSDDFCWLLNDIAFYVGVVAYFLLVFVLCLLVFVVVMVQLSRIKKRNPQNQSPNRGVLTDLRSVSGLVVLLGLTWGFALFAWGPLYIPFVYLFTIFNSLQGFLVFVFHCAVKENVRRQWRTYLCCGRLRLAENSEWSHKATQNNRTLSTATAFTSGPHSTSGKSSVVGEGTNSSGTFTVSDPRISNSSNSDVVFNELHGRNAPVHGKA
ncbi:putative G-protein coupled receptor 64-like [Scophthalmus maximus]|uniref:Adhesion G-protein coupled receptor G2 n=1 Tax=Scophthalmus maximus TaxID=52904 RepID=A0A2U9CZA7_SCOMX|nr:putative G-protein coupled receptor 64-like [Scophthalmus maximus]